MSVASIQNNGAKPKLPACILTKRRYNTVEKGTLATFAKGDSSRLYPLIGDGWAAAVPTESFWWQVKLSHL